MNISQKVSTLKKAYRNTWGMNFGGKILLMSDLAQDLGLKVWIEGESLEVKRINGRAVLVTL